MALTVSSLDTFDRPDGPLGDDDPDGRTLMWLKDFTPGGSPLRIQDHGVLADVGNPGVRWKDGAGIGITLAVESLGIGKFVRLGAGIGDIVNFDGGYLIGYGYPAPPPTWTPHGTYIWPGYRATFSGGASTIDCNLEQVEIEVVGPLGDGTYIAQSKTTVIGAGGPFPAATGEVGIIVNGDEVTALTRTGPVGVWEPLCSAVGTGGLGIGGPYVAFWMTADGYVSGSGTWTTAPDTFVFLNHYLCDGTAGAVLVTPTGVSLDHKLLDGTAAGAPAGVSLNHALLDGA